MKCCALCNEELETINFQQGDAVELDNGESWHVDCYTEYFGEAPLELVEA